MQLVADNAAAAARRKFVRFPDLRERFGLTWTRMHIDRLEKAGRFPKRVSLTNRSVAWLEDEIIAWQDERIAARDLPRDQEPEPPLAA
jgi:prophage regulatory protein